MLLSLSAHAQRLWSVTDSEGHTSHILATQHIKHHQADLPKERLITLLDSSDALVMEVLLSTDIYQGIYTLLADDPEYSIEKALQPESYKQLSSFMKSEYGLKLGYFKAIKPIFLYLIMVQTGVSTDNQPYLEEFYFNRAVLTNKPSIGLETFEEQLITLDTLSMEQQLQLLEATIEQYPDLDQGDKLIKYYQKGKLKKLNRLQRKLMPELLYEAWVVQRNAKLSNLLAPLIKRQKLFVMIPAYQLPGPQGMLKQLKEQGFKVQAVQ